MLPFESIEDIAFSLISLMIPTVGPVVWYLEAKELNWGYSKFTSSLDKSPEIPSKTGFLFGYSLPLVALAVTYSMETTTHTSQDLVLVLNVLHYVKRDLECAFLHKYSGGMNIITCLLIGGFYSLCSFIQIATARIARPPPPVILAVGLAVFCVGELGNFYHHYLFSTLRKPGEKRYKVPVGGLFRLVCCPHYLFELVAWLGIAIAANHPAHWLCLLGFSAYLAGRSTATLAWYKKRMNGKDADQRMPENWKRLIPFLF